MVNGTSGMPLRGRDEELGLIESTLDETESGVGSVIIIEGRAGSGKTRLLEACTSKAAARSFRVGRGEADPGRAVVELDALLDALFGGEKPLVARGPLTDTRSPAAQPVWLLQGIPTPLQETAFRGPARILPAHHTEAV